MIICGRKEMKSGTVSVRKHGGKDLGAFTIEEFVKMIKSESSEKLDV
jgi:threonyl-tRNA synthetase